MQEEIIISGFGGQGALFAGQLLAYTALDQGKEVTWIPSYGPEMRGGTAHCTVIIGDEPIGSPIVRQPSTAIVMNLPSHEKYGKLVQSGGLLVVNSSLVPAECDRNDIREVRIPAS
jgi:2-oxoglutarate ferredoxin oxidoreductase subunit gamma